MKEIKVLIVDDLEDWSKAISKFLKREIDFKVIGIAMTKERALEFVRNTEIDVILMDINLTGNNLDGIDLLLEISEIKDNIKFIMMTSLKSENIIRNSILAGAVNYVFKDDYFGLPDAIRKAYNDTSPIGHILKAYSSLETEKINNIAKSLTPSETELLNKKLEGLTNKEIEKSLFKSSNTIKTQIKSILKKFNANRLTDIVTVFNITNKKN